VSGENMNALAITKPVGEYERFLNSILSILGGDADVQRYYAIDNPSIRIGFKERLINRFGRR